MKSWTAIFIPKETPTIHIEYEGENRDDALIYFNKVLTDLGNGYEILMMNANQA